MYYLIVLFTFDIVIITYNFGFETILENFNEENYKNNWVQSKSGDQNYGSFIWTAGLLYIDESNKGIRTINDFSNYAYSRKFDKSFSNYNDSLVLQFQVKFEQTTFCAGGYLKLLPGSFNPLAFNKETKYLIMFGPDICSKDTQKIQAIINYKNEYYQIQYGLRCPNDSFSHIYTLVITWQNDFKILVDLQTVLSGKIEEYWKMLPPKEIEDNSAKKPADWTDEEFIDDSNDIKPADWNDTELIPDYNIIKPEDWEDDIDGTWKPPYIENPYFKGKWKPKVILNPNFKSMPILPKIPNPLYKEDPHLYTFSDIGGIGFDLWQIESGTLFDNILITSNFEFAEKLAEETWRPLFEHERRKFKENKNDIRMEEEITKKSKNEF